MTTPDPRCAHISARYDIDELRRVLCRDAGIPQCDALDTENTHLVFISEGYDTETGEFGNRLTGVIISRDYSGQSELDRMRKALAEEKKA
jgi:hypothetical protein